MAALMFSIAGELCAIDADTHSIATGEKTVIHIENSRFTSFEKGDGKNGGGDAITLEGDARVSIERGNDKSTIRADVIRVDRAASMLYASGNIAITQTSTSGGDEKTETTADSIFLNTNTMEGVFDDGRTVRLSNGGDEKGSTMIVRSDLFGKGQNNVITFKHGQLTFCDDEDPHWHIDASRIWMLPGGEFAFLNALVYVGQTPVLYLPAFYYPKDELIFNPVMGFDKRMGYFVQTTTYLYGRKGLDAYNTGGNEEDGDFSFIKPTALKEQRREGLILHNLESNYTGQTSNFVKFMADWYGNLGYGLGLDSSFTGLEGVVSSLKAGAKIGFTQTVFRSGGGVWKPYAPSGKSYDDDATFMGINTPFRYETNFEMTINKPFTLNIKLPIYSDPYFHNDFAARNESMDWINYLITSSKGNTTDEDEDTDNTRTGTNSFSWQLDTSYSLSPPEIIKPYLNSASIRTNSMVTFNTTTNKALSDATPEEDRDAVMLRSPNQMFYYPSQITPINASASFSGTLYAFDEDESAVQKKAARRKTWRKRKSGNSTPPKDMLPPDAFKSETASSVAYGNDGKEARAVNDETAPKTGIGNDETAGNGKKGNIDVTTALPIIEVQNSGVQSVSGFEYALSYNFNPDYTSQIAYSSTGLSSPDDFDWSEKKSYMYTLRLPVSLSNSMSVGGEVATLKNTLSYDPFWQDHPYLSDDTEHGGYTPEGADSVKEADYKATKQTLTSDSTLSIKPFYYVPHFKDTGISYKQNVKIFTTDFIGDADNPKWEYLTTDWNDEDFVPTHQMDAVFAATEGYKDQFGQTLTLTATLPPRPDEYTAALKLFVPHVTYDISTGINQASAEDDTWVKQDLKQALAVTLFDKSPLRFTASYNYNLEESYHDSMKLSLDWAGLQVAYQMSYTYGYDFDSDEGWVQREEEEFQPYSFSIAYAPTPWTIHRWKNRIALRAGINTSIVSDLLRPTDSYFIFEPSLSFNIHDCFTIAFSATSENTVIYRYVQKMFGTDGRVPGEDNLWKDLADSFRFDNEDLRRSSGFKLKSINVEITHSLHDWNLNALYKMTPRLVTEGKNKHYDFSPYATISVVWRPMSSMKTEIRDDYGHWQLNP